VRSIERDFGSERQRANDERDERAGPAERGNNVLV